MQTYKKISMLLILILLMQMVLPVLGNINIAPQSTAAEITETQTWDISEEGDNSVTATLTTDGILTISGTGNMEDLNSNNALWHKYSTNITKVVIEEGVTSIGKYAFYNCRSLTSITIPESVTKIGYGAFHDCRSLTEIIIPDSVTSIGEYAFYNCTSLTSITIPEGVTSIGYYAFYNCTSLTSVTIPDSVTSIGYYAFYYCTSLTSITIPEGVTKIENGVFGNCRSLTEIIIPNSVTSIGDGAFYYCSSLTSITIPEGVTKIGTNAFYNCTSLTSITIPEGVTSIGLCPLVGCASLTEIKVDENNLNYTSEDGIVFNKDKTEIVCYPVGKTETTILYIPEGVKKIGDGAFYGCGKTEISIPESVTEIGWGAFAYNYLAEMVIPNSVTSIGDYAFWYCKNLTKISIPEGVTSIGDEIFGYCTTNLKIYTNSDYVVQYLKDNNIKEDYYVIDKEGPEITEIEGNPTEWTTENVTLTIKAEDNLVGLAEKAYSFDGGTTWQAENKKTYTENTSGIVIKVRDELGNTATYDEEINITKIMKLESITIKTLPTKTAYVEGQTFDSAGMVVMANYDNGMSKEITNYIIDKTGALTTNDSKLTISYTEGEVTKTAEQAIVIVLKGDVNGDGKVNFMDMLVINKHRLEKEKLTGVYLEAGDVTGDGEVNLSDMLIINQYRLGKRTKL